MRLLFPILALSILLALLVGCDGDPTALPADKIMGRVTMAVDGTAAAGATVYLVRDMPYPGFPFVIADSTLTSGTGWYSFTGVTEGVYELVAGVWGAGGGSAWSHITPFSDVVTVEATKVESRIMLALSPVEPGAIVQGTAMVAMDPPAPADGADIVLWRLEGPAFAPVDTVIADRDGAYVFSGTLTGNHVVTACLMYEPDGMGPFIYLADESPIFFSCGRCVVTLDTLWLTDMGVDKPAVYIYPEKAGRFQVDLGLGHGVRLTASDPVYGEGWDVFVDEDGRIDDAHDYLFYELGMPVSVPAVAGWCLDGARLADELTGLCTRHGLNAPETAEFVAYWEERLPDSPFWLAYPVLGADLDRWATLDVTPAPDSVLRLWVFFAASDAARVLPAPEVAPFEREGTTVVEWGGAVLDRRKVVHERRRPSPKGEKGVSICVDSTDTTP